MRVWRRPSVLLAAAVLIVVPARFGPAHGDPPREAKKMHGLIGKMIAVDGKRDELIAILLDGTKEMPGCLSYVVAKDPADANAVWVTEVWDDRASHTASLSLPAVKAAIAKGRPLIAKFDQHVTTEPVGGHGLPPAQGR
ncbi:MAG TPA: putative quinol monooxygenase [Gemmataceae bacterium]